MGEGEGEEEGGGLTGARQPGIMNTCNNAEKANHWLATERCAQFGRPLSCQTPRSEQPRPLLTVWGRKTVSRTRERPGAHVDHSARRAQTCMLLTTILSCVLLLPRVTSARQGYGSTYRASCSTGSVQLHQSRPLPFCSASAKSTSFSHR